MAFGSVNVPGKLTAADVGATGKSLAEQSVSPAQGQTVTASEGAEIFNDYRARAYGSSEYPTQGNVASGRHSHAEGEITAASGYASHAEGANTTASGRHFHAEGGSATASGYSSHAEGSGTASGDYSHAEGYKTTASGNNSHAEGDTATANGPVSHAEGHVTTANGLASHAEGSNTKASKQASHAKGRETTASGDYSHAEGCGTTANGQNSHAEGRGTTASGPFGSHAEGESTTASGSNSHAEGISTVASGSGSHAEGAYTTANNYASHAGGKHNKPMTDEGMSNNTTGDVFVLGNGTGETSFSNCFRVTYAGAVYGTSAFNSTGADYAEFFEWADGNPKAEDRVGLFVTLEGKQIKIANPGDYVLGVVSGQPCIIGNADEDWLGRWEHDDFGRFVKEYLEDEETEIEGLTEDEIEAMRGDPEVREKDGKLYRVTAKVVEHKTPSWRYKANPAYDNTRPYIERKDRPEWSAVGMLGVLSVRDDGTCQVNGFCRVADGGTATATEAELSIEGGQIRKAYRVVERVSENVVRIVFR